MTDIPFGTPDAGDSASEHEKMIISLAKQRAAWLERSARILNRPIGSIAGLKPEEQVADWQRHVADPTQLAQKYQDRVQVIGPHLAALEMLKWDSAMQKQAQKLAEKGTE